MSDHDEASLLKPLLLTIPEVATCLRISRAKAYVLVRRKVLPCVHVGRSKRVSIATLQHWIEEHEQEE